MTCGTSNDNHGHGHRKVSGHQKNAMPTAQRHHNLSSSPRSLTSAGSSNGSSSLPHNFSSSHSRKRSTTSWAAAAEGQKEADQISKFPNLMFSNGLTGLNPENLTLPLGASQAPSEPIYIAISTNPLILLPFVFNSATNSLVPMENCANAAISPSSLGTNLGASKPSAPIIFPNGVPSLANSADQVANVVPFSPSPSNHSSSNSSSGSTNRQISSSNSNLPFITTFSNLTQQLLHSESAGNANSVFAQVSPNSQHQTTSALINSLINSELSNNEFLKSGKKRRHSNEEADQPLDLSSGGGPSMLLKAKRSKEDPFAPFGNTFGSFDLNFLSGKMTARKESNQDGGSEGLNNFLQKFAQMQSATDSLTSSLFPGLSDSSSAASTGFSDHLASINAMARENPSFAQYLAVAMAALSGTNGVVTNSPMTSSSVPSVVPPMSPQVDVVVKQGNSRCVECNIVFYKHENYLVHKELYCASRRTSGSHEGQGTGESSSNIVGAGVSTNGAPLSNARPGSAHSSASSAGSPSLLSPSKYCNASRSPKTTGEELTMSTSPNMLARDTVSVSPVASMSSPKPSSAIFQFFCAACGIKFTSYDNLQAHQMYYCLKRSLMTGPGHAPNSSPSPVAPANAASSPVAPMLTPQQILAAAASLQGTEGLDFSSPALSQHLALITAAATAAVANQAASSNSTLAAPALGDFYCAKCKATYVSQETLTGHVCSADMRTQEKPEPKATHSTASLQTYKCTLCGYKGHTMRGMRTHVRVHSEQLAATGAYEEEFIIQNTDLPEPSLGRGRGAHLHSVATRQRRRSSIVDNEAQIDLQRRQLKHDHEQMLQQAKANPLAHLSPDSNGSLGTQNHTCQFCRYTSNYKGNVIRHIKLVHKDIAGAQLAATIALQQQALAKELQGSMSGLGDSTTSSAGDFASTTSGDLDGTDIASLKCEEASKASSIGVANESVGLVKGDLDSDDAEAVDVDVDTRHCSSCNISFQYVNSYLAHKKYYCSSHTIEA